jgi:ketosteroid isomerase-like protein
MKHIAIAVSVAVLVFGVAVLAQTQSGSVEQELIKLEIGWANAVVKTDLAFLDRILADDFIQWNSDGTSQTKAQLLAALKSGDYAASSQVLSDIKVRIYGDAAVGTGLNTSKEKYMGKDTSGQYRWTDTWIKKDGRWQCVAGHGSRIEQKSLQA